MNELKKSGGVYIKISSKMACLYIGHGESGLNSIPF